MNINCTNQDLTNEDGTTEDCAHEFKLNVTELELEVSENSGTHTTGKLYTGDVLCPACNHSISVRYTCDELDDTGEILSDSVEYS